MKNYNTSDKKINVGNIFDVNRLGFDTHESGRSLTVGIEYKREKLIKTGEDEQELEDINNFFALKLATVLRDKRKTLFLKVQH